jgi:hypothetical protein
MKKQLSLLIFLLISINVILAEQTPIVVVSSNGNVNYTTDAKKTLKIGPGAILTHNGLIELTKGASLIIFYNGEFIQLQEGTHKLKKICKGTDYKTSLSVDGKFGENILSGVQLAVLANGLNSGWANITNSNAGDGWGNQQGKDAWGNKQGKDAWGHLRPRDGWGTSGDTSTMANRQPRDGWGNQQQKDGWGNQQQKDGWGNQQQKDGWGNQQQKDGWGNQQQKDGWGNQQQKDGWGNQQQKDGWGNQQQKDGWGNQQQKDGWGNQQQKDGWGNQQQKDGWGNQQQKDGWGNQQQKDGWGNQQQKDGWGNQQQKDGWGNQQQKDGWGNQQQKDGWGNQQQKDGWGNQQQKDGWGNQQQKDGWGTSGDTSTIANRQPRDGWGTSGDSSSTIANKQPRDGWGNQQQKDGWGGQGRRIHLIMPIGKLEAKSTHFSWSRPANTSAYKIEIRDMNGKEVYANVVKDTFLYINLKDLNLAVEDVYYWRVSDAYCGFSESNIYDFAIQTEEAKNSSLAKLSKSKIYATADETTRGLIEAVQFEEDHWYYEVSQIYKKLKEKNPDNNLVKMLHAAFWMRGGQTVMADAAVLPAK